MANTTFQLEQYGFQILSKAVITVPPNPALDLLATSRTRGAVALVYLNTSRGFNTSLGTDDQPFLTINGGNSNGSLSDLTLQLFFALNMTADPTQPDGYHYQSDPKFGAYSSGAATIYGREGHTGAVTRVNIASGTYARLYYFGGKNSTTYFNTLFYQDPATSGSGTFLSRFPLSLPLYPNLDFSPYLSHLSSSPYLLSLLLPTFVYPF